MRRLVIASLVLVAAIVLVAWLVLPLFLFPREQTLEECRRCPELLALVPEGATMVIVAPRGGGSLFELGRRLVPTPELARIMPAPGLIAVALADAPVVAWADADGRPGVAAAPSAARGLLVRLATAVGRVSVLRRISGGVFVAGEVSAEPRAWDEFRFQRVAARRGHFFARHVSPAGESVGVLGPQTLVITTWLDSPPSGGAIRVANHPDGAAFSLAVPDVAGLVEPIESILPVRISEWRGRGGQIIIYGVEGSGLLPSLHGILRVDGDLDPATAIERVVPRVEGATRDSRRAIAGVDVVRRDTLGVVVEAAATKEGLAMALDGESMARWLTSGRHRDEGPSVWSFSANPAGLEASLEALIGSPGRYLLDRSARRAMRRLGEVAGMLRNASVIRSSLVEGADGPEIRTRVEW